MNETTNTNKVTRRYVHAHAPKHSSLHMQAGVMAYDAYWLGIYDSRLIDALVDFRAAADGDEASATTLGRRAGDWMREALLIADRLEMAHARAAGKE
jgi:hypothetical protein